VRQDAGRSRPVRNVRTEEQIIEVVEKKPNVSTTCLAARKGTSTSRASIHPKLGQQLHPYRIQSVQELAPRDPFCQWNSQQ
jgi:hypothetical protein